MQKNATISMFQHTMHNVPNVTKCNNVTVCNVPKHNLQMLQNATVWMSESTNHNLWRLQNANSLCVGMHKHDLPMLQNANRLSIPMHNAQCFPRVDWDSKSVKAVLCNWTCGQFP
jgi:hypothetical protein